VLGGIALLQLLAIAASLSRTGMVVLAAMGLLWMARFRRFDILRFAIPVGAVLVFVVFFSSPEWRERMSTLTGPQAVLADSSIQTRFHQNALALEAFATNPILGVGFRNFGTWAGGRIAREEAIHNAYLMVAAEFGLLGIIPFLGLIGASYVEYSRCWRLCRSLRARGDPILQELYLLAVLLQISLVGTVVGNLFLSSLRYRISWMLYACSTIVLLLARQRAGELSAKQPVPGSAAFSPAHMMDTGPEQPVRV